jgi:GTP-binding protein Era
VRDELPHSLAVVVDEVAPREDGPVCSTSGWCCTWNAPARKRSSSVGREPLKVVGSAARREIEEYLGRRVYLDLRVKVAKDWQRDPRQLRRLGF